jgi:hypothetical protein
MPCSPTPGKLSIPAHAGLDNVAFWLFDTIGLPNLQFSELNHFNLSVYGLQLFLPTLNLLHYYNMPKAGYEMCWVNTFPIALTATSRVALSWRTKNFAGRQAWGNNDRMLDV